MSSFKSRFVQFGIPVVGVSVVTLAALAREDPPPGAALREASVCLQGYMCEQAFCPYEGFWCSWCESTIFHKECFGPGSTPPLPPQPHTCWDWEVTNGCGRLFRSRCVFVGGEDVECSVVGAEQDRYCDLSDCVGTNED